LKSDVHLDSLLAISSNHFLIKQML